MFDKALSFNIQIWSVAVTTVSGQEINLPLTKILMKKIISLTLASLLDTGHLMVPHEIVISLICRLLKKMPL